MSLRYGCLWPGKWQASDLACKSRVLDSLGLGEWHECDGVCRYHKGADACKILNKACDAGRKPGDGTAALKLISAHAACIANKRGFGELGKFEMFIASPATCRAAVQGIRRSVYRDAHDIPCIDDVGRDKNVDRTALDKFDCGAFIDGSLVNGHVGTSVDEAGEQFGQQPFDGAAQDKRIFGAFEQR